jgi:sterol desaturase/sphingolipid hydroxylase (fatty acid hydroxylase superfamily)
VAVLSLAVIPGSLLLVALWEFWRPRGRGKFPATRRRLANLGFWTLNLLLVAFLFAPPGQTRSQFKELVGIEFFSWPIDDPGLSFLAGFTLLDLIRYLVHRCEHAVPLFWRFHALHHSDPDVDVTTSVRHHPVEYVLASAIYWLASIVLDVPSAVALAHGFAVFGMAALQHGNIRLPEWLERFLQPVVITVDLHRVHHSIVYEEANANFGAVLSIWDRMFGTYRCLPPARHQRIVFGVRELPPRGCLNFSRMLLTPLLISRRPRLEVTSS